MDNPLDDPMDNYLKPYVRWLDYTNRMRPADRDTLLVPIKHTVDILLTGTCHFTVMHLMKIQRAVFLSLCKFNQTAVCHSSRLFNSRMGLTCFALS